MRVIWTPQASQDRIDIWEYIATDDPPADARMDSVFGEAATRLLDHPRIGRQGMVTGTLELIPHEHYRLVYEIESDTVWILALVHTSRQWPPVQQ